MKTLPNSNPTVRVIFRKFHGGEIIALFPEIPSDVYGHQCESYMRIGQHGGASPNLPNTSPAKPEEYADLKRELERIGYKLEVRKKITAAMHRIRKTHTPA